MCFLAVAHRAFSQISIQQEWFKHKVIAKRVIPEIEAPNNLVPVTETVEFDLAGKKWHKIVIDRDHKIEEIYEENNEAMNESELN